MFTLGHRQFRWYALLFVAGLLGGYAIAVLTFVRERVDIAYANNVKGNDLRLHRATVRHSSRTSRVCWVSRTAARCSSEEAGNLRSHYIPKRACFRHYRAVRREKRPLAITDFVI